MNETYLNVEETASKLRKSQLTIRRWINDGFAGKRLPAKKVGRTWFVSPSTLDKFLYDISKPEAI